MISVTKRNERNAQKARWNKRNYDTFLVRVRKDSDLADRIAQHKLDGQSLNSLVNMLLASHFGVCTPLKYFTSRTVRRLI